MYSIEIFKFSFENSFTINPNSAFFESIRQANSLDLFNYMMQGTCNFNINFYSLKYNHTPLSYALALNKPAIALQLIKAGAEVNFPYTGIGNNLYDNKEFIHKVIQKISNNPPRILEKFEQFQIDMILKGKTPFELAFSQALDDVAIEILKSGIQVISFNDHDRLIIIKNSKLLKMMNYYLNSHLLKDPIPEESSKLICLINKKIKEVEEKIQEYKQIANDNFFIHAEICKDFYRQHSDTILEPLPVELITKITSYIDFSEMALPINDFFTTEVIGNIGDPLISNE